MLDGFRSSSSGIEHGVRKLSGTVELLQHLLLVLNQTLLFITRFLNDWFIILIIIIASILRKHTWVIYHLVQK